MSRLTDRVRQLVPEAALAQEVGDDHALTLYGPPGTGKTSAMLRLIDAHLESGACAADQLMIATFTRNARSEARGRLLSQGANEADLEWVSTIHSACFRLAHLQSEHVMQPSNYREFGEPHGWDFSLGRRDIDDPLGGGGMRTYGDWLLCAEELRRARMIGFEEAAGTFEVPESGSGWDAAEAEQFSIALQDYKRQTGLCDYADMLDMVLADRLTPPCTHYFVDEAQDLTPHQWAVIDLWTQDAKRLFVMGDDDQALFRWSGADPELFNARASHKMVLTQSWRLPGAVHGEADRIVNRILSRVGKVFRPRNTGGAVSHVYDWQDLDFPDDGVRTFLLARNRMHLSSLRSVLMEQGVPYLDRTSDMGVPDPASMRAKAARTLLALSAGQLVMGRTAIRTVRRQIDYRTRQRLWPQDQIPKLAMFRIADLIDCGASPALVDMIEHDPMGVLPNGDYLRSIVASRGPGVLETKPQYELSTVHGSKGEEAERVAVCTAMTRQTYEGYLRAPDDEHRVMYVGATRARQQLTWVDLFDSRGRRYDI